MFEGCPCGVISQLQSFEIKVNDRGGNMRRVIYSPHIKKKLTTLPLLAAGGVLLPYLFTDSALWAGSVIESRCPFVCLCVITVVIVDYGQTVRVFVFFHKT